jgi:NAD-dependent dihydropyrimidine dehydrogenase PreA subunit
MMEEEGFPNIIRDDDVRHRETVLNPALVVIPEECVLDRTCLLDTRPESSIHIDDDHQLQQNLEHKRGSLSSRYACIVYMYPSGLMRN